ncbi:GlxA family transcriptional regulator [Colwellia sp. MB02u-10]|jgi:AraC family carnitine catabolism transcriptional activator|uniref:GlxA family transcriptional regulator n=1 Tax=Colwellia sp. MB02u-10 TaxID=2759828 RepID=UPI0015F52A04|nr:GlxA family transcriptional regulator [Colwellia sp. MB02u-10]MBA6340170.1 GlxA family transcriptional regulator [Colwellia sp. MB02u-10]
MSNVFLPPKFSDSEVVHIAFILVEQFSLFALASVSEPLRVANRLADEKLFEFSFISENGKPVKASNQVAFNTKYSTAKCPTEYQTFIVVSGFEPLVYASKTLLAELRRLSATGVSLGGVDTGAQILIKAGVMTGHRATMHWEAATSFQEENPRADILQERFLIEDNRVSSAGGLSSLDMMLSIIATNNGQRLAMAVAEQFTYNHIQSADESQRMSISTRLMTKNRKLIKAASIMEKNLTNNMSIKEISERAFISQRELERLFSRKLKTTPKRYYRKIRLEHARRLLRQTDLSVLNVSLACGFSSASYLSAIYKQEFNIQPSKDRGEHVV